VALFRRLCLRYNSRALGFADRLPKEHAMFRTSILSACLALFANSTFAADEGLALTEQHLQAGTLSAGEAALESHLQKNPRDDQACLGLGMVQFVRSIEGLTQAAYRHGFLQPLLKMIPES
jgi:hypothetical protein